MSGSRTYLSVPFAQKDEAKALGARWDAANKKWFVPADRDITLFTKWQAAPMKHSTATIPSKPPASAIKKTSMTTHSAVFGATTFPTDKNFIAYNGDEPPWD
jgi:hypothetical protein